MNDDYWILLDDTALEGTTARFANVVLTQEDADGPVRIFEWAPGDGTRYSAIISQLPRSFDGVPHGEGFLVSFLHPCQATALFMGAQQGDLVSEYVASNLNLAERDLPYTADALTVMLAAILKRPAVVRAEWWRLAKWSFMTDEALEAARTKRSA